jgi:hypothetical protein
MNEEYLCPICGGNLIADALEDYEITNEGIVITWLGRCSDCNQLFFWTGHYKLNNITNVIDYNSYFNKE